LYPGPRRYKHICTPLQIHLYPGTNTFVPLYKHICTPARYKHICTLFWLVSFLPLSKWHRMIKRKDHQYRNIWSNIHETFFSSFQVVTLATYVFFIFTLIGRQKIDTLKKGEYMRSGRMPLDIDLYIPVYTILQFFFYMGLLKVRKVA
jgi:hypothetical protein